MKFNASIASKELQCSNIPFIEVTLEVSNLDKSTSYKIVLENKYSIVSTEEVFIFPKFISYKLVHPSNIEFILVTFEASK